MAVQQISVFLENKPGTLKKMTATLAAHDIDIRALSLAETKDFGIARMVLDDPLSAVNLLKEENFVASLTSVLVIKVNDVSGGLDGLLAHFTEAEVNIEYMYAFTASEALGAYVVFRVDDVAHAQKLMDENGMESLDNKDLF